MLAKKLPARLAAHLSHAATGPVSADLLQRRINVTSCSVCPADRLLMLLLDLVLCVTDVFTGAALCTCLHHAVGTLICSHKRDNKVELELRLFCQTG